MISPKFSHTQIVTFKDFSSRQNYKKIDMFIFYDFTKLEN